MSLYSSTILATPDLKLYWKLDENFGIVVVDSSPFGHNSTYYNTPSLGQDPLPDSDDGHSVLFSVESSEYAFTGSSEVVGVQTTGIGGTDPPAASRGMGLEFWVKTTQSGTGNPMIVCSDDGATNGRWFQARISTSGKLEFVIFSAGADGNGFSSSVNINDGVKHHVVCNCDNDTAAIYVDNVLVGGGTPDWVGTGMAFRNRGISIGARTPITADVQKFFDGTVDEISIYARPLTTEEISDHFNPPIPGAKLSVDAIKFRADIPKLSDEFEMMLYPFVPFGAVYKVATTLPAGSIVTVDFSHLPPFKEFEGSLLEIKGLDLSADSNPEIWGRLPFGGSVGAARTDYFFGNFMKLNKFSEAIASPQPIPPLPPFYTNWRNTTGILTKGGLRTFTVLHQTKSGDFYFSIPTMGMSDYHAGVTDFAGASAGWKAYDFGVGTDEVHLSSGPTINWSLSGSPVPNDDIYVQAPSVTTDPYHIAVTIARLATSAAATILGTAGSGAVSDSNVLSFTLTRDIVAPSSLSLRALIHTIFSPDNANDTIKNTNAYPNSITDNVSGSTNYMQGRISESIIGSQVGINSRVDDTVSPDGSLSLKSIKFRAFEQGDA